MKVDVVKDGTTIKSFDIWRKGEKRDEPEKSFSFQLLDVLRRDKHKVDIMDVRELLELGADPNFKLMVHTDEELLNKQIDSYIENEIPGMPTMHMWKVCTPGYAISIQGSRPDVIEAILKSNKLDPNLDVSDVAMMSGAPTPFYSSATAKTKDIKVHERILDMYVKLGANVNVVDSSGETAIYRCMERENFEIIPKLIEIGVDPFKPNKYGETPYDLTNKSTRGGLEGQQIVDPPNVQEAKDKLRDMLRPPVPPAPEKRSIFGSFGKKRK